MFKSYSVKSLNSISKNKEIWCFGCGKRLNDVLALYNEEPFIGKITELIDNNKLLWGQKKRVGERQIAIKPPDIIRNQGNRNIILLITSDSYEEIYKQLFHVLDETGVICSCYPKCYYSYLKVLRLVFRLFPMRRQMLFNSGKEPHENTKAIVDFLVNKYEGKEYKLVFIEDNEIRFKKSTKMVFLYRNTLKVQSRFIYNLKYCFYVATSKYLLYENEPLKKVRRGQVLIYLNHGTIPLKNVKDVLRQPEELDYALCPSKGCSEIYEQQYGIPIEKLWYIMPPRDVYLTKKVQKLYRFVYDANKQVIIWLPTFRELKDSNRKDSLISSTFPLITSERDFYSIEELLVKNEQLLIIKCHPREKTVIDVPKFCRNIKFIREKELEEKESILQEILAGSSALLTDYSGICFEYFLLDKPIGYVISDMNSYVRGFAFDNPLSYMPGEKIRTLNDLMCFLDDVKSGKDRFRKERKKLMEKLFMGNELKCGAEELIKKLEKKC